MPIAPPNNIRASLRVPVRLKRIFLLSLIGTVFFLRPCKSDVEKLLVDAGTPGYPKFLDESAFELLNFESNCTERFVTFYIAGQNNINASDEKEFTLSKEEIQKIIFYLNKGAEWAKIASEHNLTINKNLVVEKTVEGRLLSEDFHSQNGSSQISLKLISPMADLPPLTEREIYFYPRDIPRVIARFYSAVSNMNVLTEKLKIQARESSTNRAKADALLK